MKTVPNALFLLYLALLSGCVSPVHTDYDREAVHRFDHYKCFEIVTNEQQEDDINIVLSPIVNRRIERELSAVLKSYGFTDKCSRPDFRVRCQTVKKTVNRLHEFRVGLFYERRYGCSGSAFGSYPQLQIDQYEEGTFLVDIIDTELDEIVWRGAYVKRLGSKAPTDREIRVILNDILARFPPAKED